MPNELWTILATVIGGGIVWFTTRQQLHHQRRAEAERRFVEKMELLHGALTKLSAQSGLLQMTVLGKVGFNADPKADQFKGISVDTGTMQMLVDCYAPHLKPEATIIEGAFLRLSEAVVRSLLEVKPTDKQKADFTVAAVEATRLIHSTAKAAQAKIGVLVRPHSEIPEAVALHNRFRRRLTLAGRWLGRPFRRAKSPS
ncbi:MAG: hypothetical protein WC829_21010 [Hyphomicrobium sp.]|jgi:hypothetical protein